MNRTKIIATLGPASNNANTINESILGGVNVFRLNMSHCHNKDEVANSIDTIRKSAAVIGVEVGILMDIAGPKIRVKNDFEDLKVSKGDILTVGFENSDIEINMNIEFKSIGQGSRIKIDDGKLSFNVSKKISDRQLEIESNSDGIIISNKGVNFPNIVLDVPVLTPKDIKDIEIGIDLDVDWFALSFVRSGDDVNHIKNILNQNGVNKPIIAKIEKPEAVDNLKSIVESFDAILVARGDLGVEMGFKRVPVIQRKIVRTCHKYGKPIILATQMLESMIQSDSPTRAEVNDVAVAVEQSCDAVMLSAETTIGQFPVETIKMMRSIIVEVETDIFRYSKYRGVRSLNEELDIQSSICYSAARIANRLDIDTIIAMTESGSSALSIAACRPKSNIISMSPSKKVCEKVSLIWGLRSVVVEDFKNTDEMIEKVESHLISKDLLKSGDRYVIIAGVPVGISGTTNMIRVETIS